MKIGRAQVETLAVGATLNHPRLPRLVKGKARIALACRLP